MDFVAFAQQCAPTVHHSTLNALATVESNHNPFAIGVVGAHLVRMPANKDEAVATAKSLEAQGLNFSVGMIQVNRFNLARYGLTYETAFEPCANVRAGAAILTGCYQRAAIRFGDEQQSLRAAMSCYYSGNFERGFRPDFSGQPSYVQKILNAAGAGRTRSVRVSSMPAGIKGETEKLASDSEHALPNTVMVFR